MGVGVVLDPVAAAGDLGGDLRVGFDPPADAEEGRPGAGAVQQVEHAGGDVGVGAVVEGEGDLVPPGGALRQTEEVGPHELAPGPEAGGGEGDVVREEETGHGPPVPGRRGEGQSPSGVQAN
jgi:hypothetical protein